MEAKATGSGPIAFQWQFDGTNLPGATNATLILSNITPAQAGKYSVVVSNSFGTTQSSNVLLSVAASVEALPASQTVFVGSTVSLSTPVSGPAPLSYQWLFGGVALPGATDKALVLTNAQVQQAGQYSVIVNGPAGAAQSPNATVFVTQAAVWGADFQTNAPGDLTNVASIAGGVFHTLALKSDGTVKGWGFANYENNDFGQAVPPAGLSNVDVGMKYAFIEAEDLVATFQFGWAHALIGLDGAVPIVSYVPLFMFAVLFGLSMDYEVFLVSQIKEHADAGEDTKRSVVSGLVTSGRVITAAATIMVFVFGSFVLNGDPTVKQFGIGLAAAVILDATVVRCLLVPARMARLGKANWYLPRWLGCILPRINIEGEEYFKARDLAPPVTQLQAPQESTAAP
jgi:uncharacterized membrane protein YdfJ with MMPL/SSD domain